MTRDEAAARGRRALAAGFGWAPRVRAWVEGGLGVLEVSLDIVGVAHGKPHTFVIDGDRFFHCEGNWPETEARKPWPDFRDPATVGVLRAQVGERVLARGSRAFWTEYEPANEEWHPMHSWDMPHGTGQDCGPVCGPEETELDALLAALEGGHDS